MSFQTKYLILLHILFNLQFAVKLGSCMGNLPTCCTADGYNSSEDPEELKKLPELPKLSGLCEFSELPELRSAIMLQEIESQDSTTDVLPYFRKTSSEIINDVKIKFDDFRNSIQPLEEFTKTNKSHSPDLSLLIQFFKQEHLYTRNNHENALDFFSVIFVLYYAVEYYLGHILHEIRNELRILNSNRVRKSNNASNKINFIREILFEIIEAFETEFDSSFSEKYQAVKNKKKNKNNNENAVNSVPRLRTYNIYELTDKNINDIDRLERITTNLKTLLRYVFLIHSEIKDYKNVMALVKEHYKPKKRKIRARELLNNFHNHICEQISNDLKVFRSYIRQYQFAKDIRKFPISGVLENSSHSKYEISFWNDAAKNVNEGMNAFELLQSFDEIRNDMIEF